MTWFDIEALCKFKSIINIHNKWALLLKTVPNCADQNKIFVVKKLNRDCCRCAL